MKKILSLTLAVMLLVSAIPTAFAADQDYSLGTAVTVEGAGGEYTVTVPATLSVGDVGTVTAKGYWAKEEYLTVTAPETITVTNTETAQTATVNVTFAGIESLGDDLNEKNIPVDISVDAGNTKFGTWTGVIEYQVDLITTISFTCQGVEYLAAEGATWETWIESDLSPAPFKIISGTVYYSTGAAFRVADAEGNEVSPSALIVNGATYSYS